MTYRAGDSQTACSLFWESDKLLYIGWSCMVQVGQAAPLACLQHSQLPQWSFTMQHWLRQHLRLLLAGRACQAAPATEVSLTVCFNSKVARKLCTRAKRYPFHVAGCTGAQAQCKRP